MKPQRSFHQLSDKELRELIDQANRRALGGRAGAVARAGLGTLALVLAVFASTEGELVGIILLCGIFILGLGAYFRAVVRSISALPRPVRRPLPVAPARPRTAAAESPIGRTTDR